MPVLIDMRTICVHWQKAYHNRMRVAKFIKSFVNAGLTRVAAGEPPGEGTMRVCIRLVLEFFVSIFKNSSRNPGV
jgi:hypothetical protein